MDTKSSSSLMLHRGVEKTFFRDVAIRIHHPSHYLRAGSKGCVTSGDTSASLSQTATHHPPCILRHIKIAPCHPPIPQESPLYNPCRACRRSDLRVQPHPGLHTEKHRATTRTIKPSILKQQLQNTQNSTKKMIGNKYCDRVVSDSEGSETRSRTICDVQQCFCQTPLFLTGC